MRGNESFKGLYMKLQLVGGVLKTLPLGSSLITLNSLCPSATPTYTPQTRGETAPSATFNGIKCKIARAMYVCIDSGKQERNRAEREQGCFML
jgi:hypothetical protein